MVSIVLETDAREEAASIDLEVFGGRYYDLARNEVAVVVEDGVSIEGTVSV